MGLTPEQKEHRKLLTEGSMSSWKSLDSAITLISTGTIVLSMTLIDEFASPLDAYLMEGCWAFLIICLAAHVTAFGIGAKAFEDDIDVLDNEHLTVDNYKKNKWRKRNSILNWVARGALIIGVLLFSIYGFKNVEIQEDKVENMECKCECNSIEKEENMAKSKPKSSGGTRKESSLNPPKPPKDPSPKPRTEKTD